MSDSAKLLYSGYEIHDKNVCHGFKVFFSGLRLSSKFKLKFKVFDVPIGEAELIPFGNKPSAEAHLLISLKLENNINLNDNEITKVLFDFDLKEIDFELKPIT